MDIGIISVRYAKALFLFATKKNEEERVFKEMTTLALNYERVPKIRLAMESPIVKAEQKAALLKAACIGKDTELSTSTARFIQLLVERGRANMANFMAYAYQTLYCEQKHLVKASLVLPESIDEALIAKLRQAVERRSGSQVSFEVSVRPEIEGGFILHYDTYCLDASLRTQIEKLRRELIQ